MSDAILASHILVMYSGSSRSAATRSKEEAAALVAQVKAELDAGGDFERLASTYSDCASSSRGGDWGLFGRGEMVPAFDEVAFALAIDETSEVVETEFGYHIIYRMG